MSYEPHDKRRVISMVPSWTETLIEAGIPVVGRTRFCIYPRAQVSSIPTVGGTKDWNLDKVLQLQSDLLVFDQEENPKIMAETAAQNGLSYFSSHITSVHSMPQALRQMNQILQNPLLTQWANEWDLALQHQCRSWDIEHLPAVLEWGQKPSGRITKILYVIWKNPWMVVSQDTFIGSMLSLWGLKDLLPLYPKKYPEVDLENEPNKDSTLLLFSSEPYPFLKKRADLDALGFPYAFADGESLSWFGVRSLRFLQNSLLK